MSVYYNRTSGELLGGIHHATQQPERRKNRSLNQILPSEVTLSPLLSTYSEKGFTMLPDFPQVKEDIHELFMTRLRRPNPELAPLVAQIPHRRQHEGLKGKLRREDGSEEEIEIEEFSDTVTFEYSEFGHLSLEEAYGRYREAAAELAKQKEKQVISNIAEVTEETGNYFDAEGEELSPEHLLRVFESLRIDFDDNGDPIMPSIVLHPDMEDKIKKALEKLSEEPFKSEMEEIIQQKRSEWNDRENRRKLVD